MSDRSAPSSLQQRVCVCVCLLCISHLCDFVCGAACVVVVLALLCISGVLSQVVAICARACVQAVLGEAGQQAGGRCTTGRAWMSAQEVDRQSVYSSSRSLHAGQQRQAETPARRTQPGSATTAWQRTATQHTHRQGGWYSRNVGGVHEVPDGCVDSETAGNADHDIQGLVLDLWAAGTARQRAARAKGCEAWRNKRGTGLREAAAALPLLLRKPQKPDCPHGMRRARSVTWRMLDDCNDASLRAREHGCKPGVP